MRQIGEVSPGGYFQIFWQFQNPVDLLYSAVKGMSMATFIVIVGCYYGYNAGGGPVGVGKATAQSMVVNIIGIHAIGMLGHAAVLGRQPASPDRRMTSPARRSRAPSSSRRSSPSS